MIVTKFEPRDRHDLDALRTARYARQALGRATRGEQRRSRLTRVNEYGEVTLAVPVMLLGAVIFSAVVWWAVFYAATRWWPW